MSSRGLSRTKRIGSEFPVVSLLSLLVPALWLAGCSTGPAPRTKSLPDYPIGYVERGVASWYGPGFHGNQTANGERYDMHRLTAAHRTLPLGSVVEVRSLSNGRRVKVRVNDRGPFVRGRIIDLSLAAAKGLGMTVQGTDRVEIVVVGYQGRPGGNGFLGVQVGSFAEKDNALALKATLARRYPNVRVVSVDVFEGRRYRVLVGKFRSERQADALAVQLAAQLEIQTLVVRDDT